MSDGRRGLTRRSLLAAAAGAAAGGFARAPGASAQAPAETGIPVAGAGRSAADAAMRLATPVLPAGSGQPPIIAREAWALGRCPPRVAPEYGAVELAFVHHTETPNGYLPAEVPGMLRSIYNFHRYGRGWNDIGYNFVVDRFGRVFEARAGGIDEPVIGAQAGGYNYRSTGIAVLGEYGAQRISAAAASALARLLAWKLSLHGVPVEGWVAVRVDPTGAAYSRFPANARVSLERVAGHRDADSTSCPGNALYGELPPIRTVAAHLQGRPARLTLAPQVAPAAAPETPSSGQGATGGASGGEGGSLSAGTTGGEGGSPSAGTTGGDGTSGGSPTGATEGAAGALGGRLTFLDGAPIAGAPIEVQARSVSRRGEQVQELTLARTQTAVDGSWSLPFYDAAADKGAAVRAGVALRALCPGAPGVPATVSEAAHVASAVSFMPPAPPPTPEAAPPPAQ